MLDLISDRPVETFGPLMVQLARRWRSELDRLLSPYGLTQSCWRVLIVLAKKDRPVVQQELAEILGIQGPTLVRTLDGLQTQGLIIRRSLPSDGRTKGVLLTDKAMPTVKQINSVINNVNKAIFNNIDEADLQRCLDVFEQIHANLDQFSGVDSPENLSPHTDDRER